MACFYCTSYDQHLLVVNEMLKATIEDMKSLCTGLANKELKMPSLEATLIYNDLVDIQAYLLKLRDSPEDLSDCFSDFFDDEAEESLPATQPVPDEDEIIDITVPDSPVFQSASASASGSSVLPRSDACSNLSLSGPLKRIKKLNDELAKKNPGTFIIKKDRDDNKGKKK